MREIKFKLWNVKKKKFYGPYSIYKINYGDSDPDEWIPIQFTGLHDRTGKEIYEGDLIRTYINLIFVVKFTMGAFWIEWINKSESEDTALQLLSAKNTSSVVIGNRFENPELLEEVK